MKFLSFLFLIFSSLFSYSQNVGIGTSTPHASAALEIKDSTKGILIPRMTMAQRNAIANPAEGLMVYQTDSTYGFWYWGRGQWRNTNQYYNPHKYYYFNGCCDFACSNYSGEYTDFKNFNPRYNSDNQITYNRNTGEFTFNYSGLYKVSYVARIGNYAVTCYDRLVQYSTSGWNVVSNSVFSGPIYSNIRSDNMILNITGGDKIKLQFANSQTGCLGIDQISFIIESCDF